MKFNSLKVYNSNSLDPFLNLAIENQLLKEVLPGEKIIFFYTNNPSVVMGRFQNPWVECKVGKMYQNNVQLVRRQSGGGCVYHDLGNLNFSFIQATREHLKDQNNEIIINALKKFSLNAFASGRSDLLIFENNKNYKFSGSAFKQKKDRSFHHGTLLIDANLNKLNDYLFAKEKKIEAKGIKSVRSEVINLSNLNPNISRNDLIKAISKSCEDYYEIKKFDELNVDHLLNHDEVLNYKNQLIDWQWLYGETPSFNIFATSNTGEINLLVNKGTIENATLISEVLHPALAQNIEKSLIGIKFEIFSIQKIMNQFIKQFSMFENELKELLNSISTQVEI